MLGLGQRVLGTNIRVVFLPPEAGAFAPAVFLDNFRGDDTLLAHLWPRLSSEST